MGEKIMSAVDFFWILVFLPIALLSVYFSRKVFNYWFTPLSVFLGMNSISLVFYHFRLLPMVDVSVITHVLVLASLCLFVLGTLMAIDGRPIDGSKPAMSAGRYQSLDQFFYITFSLATVGWVAASVLLIFNFGFGVLLRNIWMLQGEFQMQYLGYLNLIGILVLPTYVVKRGFGSARNLDLILVIVSLFGLLLAGIKGYLIYSVLAAVFAWSAVRPDRFRFFHLGSGMAALLGFFILYGAKIDIFTGSTFAGSGFTRNFSFLFRPYYYFVGSWPAMENVVNGSLGDLPRLGMVTLQPFWKLLIALGQAEPMEAYNQFVNIGQTTFNVYSFVGEVYWDLKWPGVLGFSWLLGFGSTRLYARALKSRYWGHILIYAVIGYGLFLTFFAYIYTFNVFVILGYVFVVGFVFLRQGVLVEGESYE